MPDFNIVIKATDAASPSFDNVAASAEKSAARIRKAIKDGPKTFDQKGESGSLGVASDGFKPSEGAGALAKAGAALAIAEVVGQKLTKFGTAVGDIVAKSAEANASFAETSGEIARAIPGVGTLAKGFDSIQDAGWDIASSIAKAGGASENMVGWLKSGATALKEAQDEAAKLDVTLRKGYDNIAKNQKARADNEAIIARGLSETAAIAAKRDADIAEREKAKKEQSSRPGGLTAEDSKKFADAEAQIRKEASEKIGAIENKAFNDRAKREREYQSTLASEEKNAADIRTSIAVSELREKGRVLEANLIEIRQREAEALDAINKKRDTLTGDSSISVEQRMRMRMALDDESDAVRAQRAASEASARKAESDKAAKSRQDIVDSTTTAARELIEKSTASNPITRQGGSFAAAVDGRFRGASIAEGSRVETSGLKTAQETAANTKAMQATLAGMKTQQDAILRIMQGTPV